MDVNLPALGYVPPGVQAWEWSGHEPCLFLKMACRCGGILEDMPVSNFYVTPKETTCPSCGRHWAAKLDLLLELV